MPPRFMINYFIMSRYGITDKTGNALHRAGRFILAVACLLVCFAVSGCAEEGQLTVNEVVSSNHFSYVFDELGSADWIELKNNSKSDINLRGYILSDKADTFEKGCLLPDITIPAGGFALIPAGSDAKTDAFCLPFGLSRTGDTLYLLTPSGKLIEKIVIPALREDVSYARNAEGAFGYCLNPTPGTENSTAISFELSGQDGIASAIEVVISEVVTSDYPTGACGGADWVELYNPSQTEVSLDGCYLTDDDTEPKKQRITGVTLPAGGYAILTCDKSADAPAAALALALSSSGEMVSLYDMLGNLIDSVKVPPLTRGDSYARAEDGTFSVCIRPTPLAANTTVGLTVSDGGAESAVRLNEAGFSSSLYVTDSYGDRSDFAELYNSSAEEVCLKGCYLSDDRDNLEKWAFPEDTVIAPHGYLVVFLSGKGSGKNSTATELHADFSVSSDEEGVFFFDSIGGTLDFIANGDAAENNASAGKTADGSNVLYMYATPGAANAETFQSAEERMTRLRSGLYISEVSAGGTAGEWIELFNGGSEKADLAGWTLSNGKTGYALSGTVIAGGYTSFAPDTFSVSKGGETLLLKDADGFVRDIFQTGDLTDGVTSGRTESGTDSRVFFISATRDKRNSEELRQGRATTVLFSDRSLYHTEPFELTLTAGVENAEIRYSLDGKEPDEHSALYTEPIQIESDTCVRVKVFAPGYIAGIPSAQTYLFGKRHTLPVVALSCNPVSFKAYTRIKEQGGRHEETSVSVSLYEADGSFGVSFNAGLKPRGNTSIKYPQKSFSLHLRAAYGQTTVNYPFWGEGTDLDYSFLILRNGSQDYLRARLRDSFALRASRNMLLDSAETRPVIVYVNGVYYGIMDLNEGMNQDYLVTEYGVDKDTINHISTNIAVRYGDREDFTEIRKYARTHDLSDPDAYKRFSEWVDVDYVTDYLIAQTFFCNYDIHNQSYWGTSDYTIRYRPVFYDIDRCLCGGSSYRNLFTWYFDKKGVKYDTTHTVNMDIYAALRDNSGWCESFLNRYAELLSTDLSVERLQALLDTMESELAPEMEGHIALYHAPASVDAWHEEIAVMRSEIEKRHAAIQKQLMEEFGLSEKEWAVIIHKYV